VAMQAILADGTIDETEVKLLQKHLKSAGEEGLEFLLELRAAYSKKAKAKGETLSDVFENYFFKTISGHVVQEGKLSSSGAGYLRDKLFPGAKVDDRGYTFLTDLNKKAKEKAPEFDTFLQDVEKKRAKAKK
jgi:hypothetical protein